MENQSRQIALDRKRMAPWRKELPEKFLLQIARKQPFQVEPLREYLMACNDAVVRQVEEHIRAHGPLKHPHPGNGGVQIGIKACTDSRAVITDPAFSLKYGTIYARTAGNVVRNAALFKTLSPGGLAIVNGHRTCGACAAAHALVDQEMPDIDVNILAILTTIPYYVRARKDHAKRDRENAKIQAHFARRILKNTEVNRPDIYVYPSFYDWTEPEPLDWLRHRPNSAPADTLQRTARKMTEYAMAEGRDFTDQYAAFTLLYDAYRVGRLDDPFGRLGNEIFTATGDFRSFDKKMWEQAERLSATAMGSVMYAGYDSSNSHHGHVSGVGKHDGTHILGILDICADTLHHVKAHLLANYPLIRDLTEGGKRIMLMHYNRDTAQVTFLDD
jgi:hypothetical protein